MFDHLFPPNGTLLFFAFWVWAFVFIIVQKRAGTKKKAVGYSLMAAVVLALLVPPLLDAATGQVQAMSLRNDLNTCASGTFGRITINEVTNTCADPIIVGVCTPDELNPETCSASQIIEPGSTVDFQAAQGELSSRPLNQNGATVVACNPSHRPSRQRDNTIKGHVGVCLPGG